MNICKEINSLITIFDMAREEAISFIKKYLIALGDSLDASEAQSSFLINIYDSGGELSEDYVQTISLQDDNLEVFTCNGFVVNEDLLTINDIQKLLEIIREVERDKQNN